MVVNEFVQSVRPLMAKFAIDAPDIRIQGMTLDSREVSPHVAFVAVKGHSLDGRDFIPQAISLGTPIIFSHADEKDCHGKVSMRGKSVIIDLFDLPMMLSSLAGAFYDYPANKLKTTAVTGTNGKTSTVNLLAQSKQLLGTRSAAIGTLGSGIYEGMATEWSPSQTANTTPDAINMQYLLAEFVQHGVGHVAFEASSHALVQQRLAKVKTDVAVFTNMSRDHLDYHGTMERYASAKRLLLDQPSTKAVVINGDDAWSDAWIEGASTRGIKRVVVGIQKEGKSTPAQQVEGDFCVAKAIKFHDSGCEFDLHSSWGQAQVKSALLGEFNVYNLLSTVATLLVQGERFDDVIAVVPSLRPVAGRMEVFPFPNHANVIVDYAHTPDALEKALVAMALHTHTNKWCVFGCGGDRDKGKRPEMGRIAESQAEHAIVTTDNARSEKPAAIVEDILAGTSKPDSIVAIADRESAIRYCLEHAAPDDLILVAGKGHETYQILNNTIIDYDERAVIRRLQQEFAS